MYIYASVGSVNKQQMVWNFDKSSLNLRHIHKMKVLKDSLHVSFIPIYYHFNYCPFRSNKHEELNAVWPAALMPADRGVIWATKSLSGLSWQPKETTVTTADMLKTRNKQSLK